MVFYMKKWQFFGADGHLNFDTKVDVSGIEKGTKQAGQAFQSGMAGAAKAAASDIGSIFANGLSVFLGNAMTAASRQLTSTIKGAISAGESFEAEMSRVGAISGTTGADFDRLQEKAKEMGRTTAFSATEAAEAFEYMAMAGWKTDDMLNSIEGVMNLAAASGESLGTVSDIVTDAMTAFGLAADGMTNGVSNATHFADVLAAASSNANTNVSMMGETFKYVAPLAGSLGFSVEDTAAAIGLMANAGIKGSQAGTALRSLFTRLTKPTKEVQGAMDALGLSITNSDGSMKSLEQITGDLRQAFSGLGEAEKAQVAAALAGQEAMSGLLAIVNASDADYDKLTGAIENANGAAAGMADTMLDNVAGSKKIFASAMEGFNLAVYDYLQGPLKSFYQWGSEAVSRLTEGLQGGGLSGLLSAAEGIFNEVVKKLTSKIPVIVSAAKKLAVSLFNSIKSTVPKLLKLAADVFPKITAAILRALPGILKTAGSIIKAVVTKVRESIPGIIEAVKNAVPKIISAVKTAAPKIISAALSAFKGVSGKVSELAPKVIKAAGDILKQVGAYIREHAPDIIKMAGNLLSGKIKLFGDIVKGIKDALPDIMAAAGSLFRSLVSYIGEHKEDIFEAMKGLFSGAVDIGGTVLSGLMEALSFVWENLKGFWGEHGDEIVQGVFGLLQKAWNVITEHAPDLLAVLEDVFFGILDWLLEKAPDLITTISDIIVDLTEQLPGFLDGAVEVFADFISRAAAVMDEHGGELVEAAEQAVQKITDAIGENLPHILEKGGEIIETICAGIGDKLPEIADAVGKIVLTFLKTVVTHLPDILEAGVRLLGHFVAGVIKAIPDVMKAIVTLLEYIYRAFTEIDWVALGFECLAALVKGLLGAMDLVIDAINEVLGGAIKAFLGVFGVEVGEIEPPKQAKTPKYDTYKDSNSWVMRDDDFMREGINNVGALDTSKYGYGGSTGQQFEVDYERMGQEMSKAMNGVKVDMDGRQVGQIATPYVNANLSRQAASERRGAR